MKTVVCGSVMLLGFRLQAAVVNRTIYCCHEFKRFFSKTRVIIQQTIFFNLFIPDREQAFVQNCHLRVGINGIQKLGKTEK